MIGGDAILFMGVDGGGTHTRVAIADATGRLLGMGVSGPGNYQAVGADEVARNIDAARADAWRQIDATRRPVRCAFLGMAGVVTPHDRGVMTGIADRLALADTVEVDHDIRIALAGGTGCREGVALIAGTGSACYGRRDDGRSHRAGGWGHLIDDQGSSYRLVLDGLAAVVRAIDRRGVDTSLRPILLERLGIVDPDEILRLLGSEGMGRAEIAALAPDIVDAAIGGDAVALGVLQHGADELAAMVEGVVGSLPNLDGGAWSAELVVAGGTFDAPLYRGLADQAIAQRLPSVRSHPPRMSPRLGATLLAMVGSGIRITDELLATISTSHST